MIGYFRKRKRVAWIVTLLLSVTILFGMSGTTVSAATGAVADDVTIGHWHDSIAIDDTTKNIGRIWTDKSVSAGNIVMGKLDNSGTKTVEKNGDSDFLVFRREDHGTVRRSAGHRDGAGRIRKYG